MARARPLLVYALALTLPACGSGNSPVAPTGPTSAVDLIVRDGWDERPVAGASVSVGSGLFPSQSDGRVSVSVASGTPLRVDAAGFLKRETAYRGKPELELWSTVVTNLDYIFALGYNLSPGVKLSRPDLGAAQVVVSDEIRGDAAAFRSVQAAIAEINHTTGGQITLSLDSPAPVSFRLAVDLVKSREALGATYTQYRGNLIVGADIYFRTIQDVRTITPLHELGHAIGLGHSPEPDDIMFATLFTMETTFSDRERRIVAMMLKRSPGNAFPDNDQGLAVSSAREPIVTVPIICPGR